MRVKDSNTLEKNGSDGSVVKILIDPPFNYGNGVLSLVVVDGIDGHVDYNLIKGELVWSDYKDYRSVETILSPGDCVYLTCKDGLCCYFNGLMTKNPIEYVFYWPYSDTKVIRVDHGTNPISVTLFEIMGSPKLDKGVAVFSIRTNEKSGEAHIDYSRKTVSYTGAINKDWSSIENIYQYPACTLAS